MACFIAKEVEICRKFSYHWKSTGNGNILKKVWKYSVLFLCNIWNIEELSWSDCSGILYMSINSYFTSHKYFNSVFDPWLIHKTISNLPHQEHHGALVVIDAITIKPIINTRNQGNKAIIIELRRAFSINIRCTFCASFVVSEVNHYSYSCIVGSHKVMIINREFQFIFLHFV